MKRIFAFMDRYRDGLDLFIFLAVIILFMVMIISFLCSCAAPNPLAVITPPGMAKNTVRPTLTTFVAVPASTTNIVLTCDIGPGSYNGVNIYGGNEPWNLTLLGTSSNNVISVAVPVDWPSLLEARTFINWPPPYVVNCFTNDDSSTGCITNLFYEGTNVADFIFVPTNCANQWVFLNNDGTTTLAGWGLQDVTYQISSGQLQALVPVTTVTGTNGPWLHTATGEGPDWATKVILP